MLTHLFQLWLTCVVFGVVFYAIMTEVKDRREDRRFARENAADAYAVHKIQYNCMIGKYDHLDDPDDIIEDDFEFYRLAHLCQN